MAVEGRESNIKCPVLLTVGEYDARCPIELVQNFYNNITAPKELWVYEDAYHNTTMFPGDMVRLDCQSMGMDWMVEAIGGKFEVGYNHSTFLRTGGGGPNGTQGIGQDPQHWWE
jgi:hypothetical protein